MTDQPQPRQNRDGLAAALVVIAGRCSSAPDSEVIIRAAKALRAPTRDEGAITVQGAFHNRAKRESAATPQPAPDAMRNARRNQLDVLHRYRTGAYALAETALDDILSLSAPVPPADGATAQDFWHELVEKTDRTSPEDYPEMALITFEELRDFVRRALSPSATGAAEPGSDEELEARLLKQDARDMLRLLDYIADKIGLPHNEELSRDNFNAWLATPVRGDREIPTRDDFYKFLDKHTSLSEATNQFLCKTAAEQYGWFRPVQPGAGERGDVRIDKAYADGVRACLRRLEHLRRPADDKAWKDCEAMWRNRIAEVEAFRQPPQSSREG